MTADVSLLASSLVGDGLSPSPYKEALAECERLRALLIATRDKLATCEELLRDVRPYVYQLGDIERLNAYFGEPRT